MRTVKSLMVGLTALMMVSMARADSVALLQGGSQVSEQAGQSLQTSNINSIPYNGAGAAAGGQGLSTGLYTLNGSMFNFNLAQILHSSTAATASNGNINFAVAANTMYTLLGGFSSIGGATYSAALTLSDLTSSQSLFSGSANSSQGAQLLASIGALVPGHSYQLHYSLQGSGNTYSGGSAFGTVHLVLGNATVVPLPTSMLSGMALLAVLFGWQMLHRRRTA